MDVTYEKISSSLGSLLLLWAAIERSAREEIVRVEGHLPKIAYGAATLLRVWETNVNSEPKAPLRALLTSTLRAQLQEPLEMRNGICHGLIGISGTDGEEAATLQWEISDGKHCITYSDLRDSLNWLSKVPFAISMISSLPEKGRMEDNPENRAWWLAEYALDLPRV